MRPLFSMLRCVLALIVLVALAQGSPVSASGKGPTECESVEKYTTEWFQDHMKDGFPRNLWNKGLFYSRGMTTKARDYAEKHGLVTIWSVWPCWLYNDAPETSNPMRCIHQDKADRYTFFENMSRAYARAAKGAVTVMHNSSWFESPPTDGIWANIEFPTLILLEDVTKITAINDLDADDFKELVILDRFRHFTLPSTSQIPLVDQAKDLKDFVKRAFFCVPSTCPTPLSFFDEF